MPTLDELKSKCADLENRLEAGEDVQEELHEAENDLWAFEENLNGIQETAEQAVDNLWDTITQIEYLQNELENAGLDNAAAQLDAYIIPHLKHWVEDEDQPGSLAMVKRAVKEKLDLDLDF